MLKLLDLSHPFFKPLWRRIAIVATCVIWTGVEFYYGTPMWGMLFAGLGALCIWQFFFDFNPRDEVEKPKAPPKEK